MQTRSLQHVLVIAALVLGQWLAIAHDYQHPLVAGTEAACQVCAHGQQLQAGPLAAPVLAKHGLSIEVPQAQPASPVLAHRHQPASIRAPPHLSV